MPSQRVCLLISSHQVKTRDSRKTPHPIPREKLAHEVAKRLMTFLKVSAVVCTALREFDVMDLVLEETSQAGRDGLSQRGGIS